MDISDFWEKDGERESENQAQKVLHHVNVDVQLKIDSDPILNI